MTFSVFVFVGFLAAALAEALPGQTGRRPYLAASVPTTPYFWHLNPINASPTTGEPAAVRLAYERAAAFRAIGEQLEKEAQELDTTETGGGSRLKVLYLEQQTPFDHNYEPIQIRITLNPDYQLVRGSAALISTDPSWKQFRSVHLPMSATTNDAEILPVFDLSNPDQGEGLRMVVLIRMKDDHKTFPNNLRPDDIGFFLRKEGD
jgi:hypothetical protein